MKALRARRRALGLSQAQLAAIAGLSRQLVGAVESGRHAPSVHAALALATALGTTVEELFAQPAREPEAALGAKPPEGSAVVVTTVGERLCYAALPERGAGTSSWQAADGVYRRGGIELFPGGRPTGAAVAGCDPALGLAAALLPPRGPQRLVAVPASSGRAATALRSGHLHAAVVHGPRGRLSAPSATSRWILAAWEVGLAARRDAQVGLEAVARGAAVVARREPGAAAQQALERALEPVGGTRALRGPLASGHLDAARRVAYGAVDAGVTMRAAAIAYDLDFTALEHHVCELHVAASSADHPAIQALGDLLSSRALRSRLASLGGYDLSEMGARPGWGAAESELC